MANPFMNAHSIQINGGDTIFFDNGDEAEDIKALSNFISDAKKEHPNLKLYAKVHFGHFQYRMVY